MTGRQSPLAFPTLNSVIPVLNLTATWGITLSQAMADGPVPCGMAPELLYRDRRAAPPPPPQGWLTYSKTPPESQQDKDQKQAKPQPGHCADKSRWGTPEASHIDPPKAVNGTGPDGSQTWKRAKRWLAAGCPMARCRARWAGRKAQVVGPEDGTGRMLNGAETYPLGSENRRTNH